MSDARLQGLVPDRLKVRSSRIILDSLAVNADIGFHDFEVGAPQRLLVTIEIWLDSHDRPRNDEPDEAWNYDFLRAEVEEVALSRRFNLQETLAHAIFERIAAFHGVRDVRISMNKPDIYPNASGVGVEIASFSGAWPND